MWIRWPMGGAMPTLQSKLLRFFSWHSVATAAAIQLVSHHVSEIVLVLTTLKPTANLRFLEMKIMPTLQTNDKQSDKHYEATKHTTSFQTNRFVGLRFQKWKPFTVVRLVKHQWFMGEKNSGTGFFFRVSRRPEHVGMEHASPPRYKHFVTSSWHQNVLWMFATTFRFWS